MSDRDPLPALTTMLRDALGDRLADATRTFPEMCAEDVRFEAPFAPGGPIVLNGREAVAGYLPRVSEALDLPRLELTAKHECAGSDTIVVEFKAHGAGASTRRPYHQRYINVITLENGMISAYVDYWNPLVLLWTTGEADVTAQLAGEGFSGDKS